jgi:mRNA-degrading endonuclease RelE of RelBE toxin-antitoxin system
MANLMIHREVFAGFGKLPSKVQKKVTELHRKFEEDSTQASIHLEKLQPMTRDPKVRSARLGDDYRAIVIAPEKGDTYVLMYIDHHDKAYRWCEHKLFEAHVGTGAFQVVDVEQAERVAEEVKAHKPSQLAMDYRLNALGDDELFQAGVPQALIPSVRAVQSDDDFERMADYLPPEARQVLYGYVCGMELDEAILEMLGQPSDDAVKPDGPGDFSHLARAVNIDLVLVEGEEQLREVLSEDIEAWRIFLHPYQRKLVEWNVKGPMKINGAAGTGKTVALMHRAVWLAKQLGHSEKVLVTTFTTNLAVTIKALLDDMSPEISKKIDVTNLHQLARTICHRVGTTGRIAEDNDKEVVWSQVFSLLNDEIEFDHQFIRSEYDQIIDRMGIDNEEEYLTTVRTGRARMVRKQRKRLWPFFAQYQKELVKRNLMTFEGAVHEARLVVEQGRFSKYRNVLVDELQDFGLEALKLIAALSPIHEELTNPLCVVGDGHQRLYSALPIPLSRAGIDVSGRSRRLKINYRTSEQIRKWSHGILAGIAVDDLDGESVLIKGDRSVFRGAEPLIATVADQVQCADAIVSWVKGLLNADGDRIRSHEICIVPVMPAVIRRLQEEGIDTLELKARQKDPGKTEPGVRFGTKKRIKGLEFKAVAMLLNNDVTEKVSRFEDYVAATRAREHLLVINIERDPS